MSRIINKKIGICILSLVLGFVIAALSTVAYAYFSKKDIYDGYLSGSVELLFDRLDDEGIDAYSSAEGITANKNAEWGSRENPYVISNPKHLYNLSVLQNLGYFEKKHISLNTSEDLSHIPYFLICNHDYTPVVIDGSSSKAISPIGNSEYPFIGSVKGVTGSTSVTVGEGNNANFSSTSVLHAVSVKGNPADPDVGLFGYVRFLGELPEESADVTTFNGTASVISNIVLSDVTVTVNSSLWDKIEAFIVDLALDKEKGHRYSFTELYNPSDNADYNAVPHENHHIGILAGHVSYSIVEDISVFYSSGSVVAIDLSDETVINETEANYLSAAGILGFIYNMNPKIDEETGNIIANSGDSLGDLSYSMVGGGGLGVGEKPGYILASAMYEKYGYIAGNKIQEGESLKISAATDADRNSLCHEWTGGISLGGNGTSHYFYDGVFTFALSSNDDVIETTWENNESPIFGLGSTSADGWGTNYKEGQKSVAAYLKKITNDDELQNAIRDNLTLVIMKETSDEGAFMMSLYNQSQAAKSGDFNEKYTTSGTPRIYATDEDIASFVESFEGSPEEFIAGFENATTPGQVEALLKNVQNNKDVWKLINLNTTVGDMTSGDMDKEIAELRQQFKISSAVVKDAEGNNVYSYFSGSKPVTVNSNGVNDYHDYANSKYDGYIYYVQGEIGWRGYDYTYYWQGKNGETLEIGSDTTWDLNITKLLTATSEDWQGETVYTRTVNGVEYKGVVVNGTAGQFHGKTDNTAVVNGQYLHKLTGGTVNYFFSPLGEDNYYYMTDIGTDNPIELSALEPTSNKTAGGLNYYQYTSGGTTYTGILLDRYYVYNFYSDRATEDKNDDNYLRMVRAQFWLGGTKYTLWNGNNTDATNPDNFKDSTILGLSARSLYNSTNATVRFNDDGTCYIQYGIDTVTQFVNYNGSAFNTAMSASDSTNMSAFDNSTKMCIYILEDTQALNYGRITFDPKSNTDHYELDAGKYVFWPEAGSVDVKTEGTESSLHEGVNTDYSVIALEELRWNNGNAADNLGILHKGNLLKKFRMIDGIAFGANIDLGFTNLGTGGLVRAPVGPEGTYTDIPAGGIAFKVNKTTDKNNPQKIRVLVAVPVSELYPGEITPGGEQYDLGTYDRYFCLWQMEENDGGGSAIFQASDYIERFEIPRSHPYQPGTTAASNIDESVTVTYDGKEYRSYLNGDRVLIAYEFKVYNEGVYVLGTSTSTSDGDGITLEKDSSPMEIVYFSADGVASSGRDGQSGSQLGTIDYVYSYNNIIVPVAERSSTDENGNEDYSTYYPTYCMLYMNSLADATDGNFVSINNEKVYIYRYIIPEGQEPASSSGYNTTASRATISFKLDGDKHTKFIQYSRVADNVMKEE